MKNRTIKVDYLARVEGEGGLYIKIKDNKVVDVKLNIFEPPRFFEAFLRGRNYYEAPDITARICGICPVAYLTSASQAMEDAFGIKVTGPLRDLRRLLYCGEYIESHPLHVFCLHAPDFLGYEDVIQLAADHPDIAVMGLRLKKLGNDIMICLGGREIHPINSKVGGFYKVPQKKELQKLTEELKWARDACVNTIRFVSTLDFPDYTYDYEFVALRHPDYYAIDDGRIVSNRGIDIPVQDFEKHYQEMHIRHANALHSVHIGVGPYKVGPLARYSLNYNQLTPLCKEEAKAAGLGPTCNNPFQSIIVRSVETLYAVEESLRLIDKYEMPDAPSLKVVPKAGVGCGASEAPRGLLYHRYRLDGKGIILDAKITPPTAQNQPSIEKDLWQFVEKRVDLPQDKLTWQCEQMIRNYDPCISCATHFLKLKLERE